MADAADQVAAAGSSVVNIVKKWGPKLLIATAVVGTLVGVPAAAAIAADPNAGLGSVAIDAVTNVFNNAVTNAPEAFEVTKNTLSYIGSGFSNMVTPVPA